MSRTVYMQDISCEKLDELLKEVNLARHIDKRRVLTKQDLIGRLIDAGFQKSAMKGLIQ